MSYVRTFEDYVPPPRYAPLVGAWTGARIEEAAADVGPWATIDTVILDPVDLDPTKPQARSFSTAAAILAAGYYRIVWLDADGAEAPTAPVAYDVTDAPVGGLLASVADLRKHLRTEGVIAAASSAADDAYLELLLSAASDFLARELPERTLAPAGTPTAPVEWRGRAGRVVQVPDLRQVVDVELDGVAFTGYRLRGRMGEAALYLELPTYGFDFQGYNDGAAYVAQPGEVLVRGVWGPPEVRPSVRLAALNLAARAYHNRTSRFADSVVDPAGGVASYFRQMPPDVQALVDSMRVPGL